jgi:hypothetical protein
MDKRLVAETKLIREPFLRDAPLLSKGTQFFAKSLH